MTSVAEHLLTVEEYTRMPDTGRPSELVRGRIVEMNFRESPSERSAQSMQTRGSVISQEKP